jgi:hypothetical protein
VQATPLGMVPAGSPSPTGQLGIQRVVRVEALVAAVGAVGGTVPLPDGRAVIVGPAEFEALLGERRKRGLGPH